MMNNNRGQRRLRFLADENISPKTVSYLNALGYNVIRVNEVKMVKAKDKEIIEYARVNRWIRAYYNGS
jgi:predicted nuclease of predicted toxin-antitoxin system